MGRRSAGKAPSLAVYLRTCDSPHYMAGCIQEKTFIRAGLCLTVAEEEKLTAIDMRMFAKNIGASITFHAGSTIFEKGDAGTCMYVIQSGVVEILIDENVVDVCGPNEAIGYMSMIDGATRSSTARAKEAVEVSIIDQNKFRFMVDEVPNFAMYVMRSMAQRIRGISKVV